MKFRINLSYNPIDGNKIAKTLEAYHSRHHSEIVRDFENQIKDLTGSKYVVALNTGTAAIHLALRALGVTKGDYVLVSTFTYVASVNPILYQEAIPFFVDSERETWNMDPELLEKAIERLIAEKKKPKAIILVHTYGMPAKLDEILSIANHHNIPVIEDAAEAIGSYYKGKHVGSFGAIGTLSFNTNKIVTTFGGGAILTESEEHYKKILFWAAQSREDKPYYEHLEVGFNYQMSPINAAVGLTEWTDLSEKLKERAVIFEKYRHALKEIPGVHFQEQGDDKRCNYWFSTLLIDQKRTPNQVEAKDVMQKLAEKGIEARLMWHPMHRQPVFQEYESILNGVSDQLFKEGLCLPSDHYAFLHQQEVILSIQNCIIKK
ncbi:MAG TPA: aminotransferase class I/II-fold pyridoxal phosphate-dependent enzyme [Chryseolinea sp.]|nr:aminotransferase class I/II-fold pyridoxal phosphate-dependent enzyme [Chryseolinea sp.]